MKMTYHEGDVFSPNKTGHELIVCNQVNFQGCMDARVSNLIHTLFPATFDACKRYCEQAADSKALLGKVLFCGENHNGFDYNIANLFVQERNCTNFRSLRKALAVVREVATPLPARALTTVRIPYRMGCDMGDDGWSIVYRIIRDELMDHDIPVEIWHSTSLYRKLR